jgi:aminopeptidase C
MADALAIPDTPWKHAGTALKPFAKAYEAGRRLGLISDEKMARLAIETFELASRPQVRGEKTVAEGSDVEQAVRRRTSLFRGRRGRAAGATAYQRQAA